MSESRNSWKIVDEVTATGELGQGSYGKVSAGDWKGAPVAVKALHAIFFELGLQPRDLEKFVKQFEAEWERLKRLRHPNIVQLFGVAGMDSQRPLMVTELMDESLEQRISSDPKLDQSTQLHVIRSIACGLRYLHELPEGPLVHRDIATKNVLLANDCSRVKIADLGVAKAVGEVHRVTSITRNFKPGTEVYMPPEVMLSPGTPPHPSLDIFSFGVVALETISGKPPSPKERIVSIPGSSGLFKAVAEVERRKSDIDSVESGHPLLKVILDCLNDRKERRPSASQILQCVPKVERLTQQSVANLTKQNDLLKLENQDVRQKMAGLRRDISEERRKNDQVAKERDCVTQEKAALTTELVASMENVARLETLLRHSDAANWQMRQSLREAVEVQRIPSIDIELTDMELGHGSYGEIRIAHWQGCPVAVKMMYEVLAAYQRNIDSWLQEASLGWTVHHPNVVALCGVTLELEGEKKQAWIIMELLQGSMNDVIDASQPKPLTLKERVDLAHDSVCGLEHLHTRLRPVLHGHIRPSNILITAIMTAKLGDLGAAGFDDDSLSVGPFCLEYEAPERIDEQRSRKNKQTDMYSMGVTLCELFTGLSAVRARRREQIYSIDHHDVRFLCEEIVSEDPHQRVSAGQALTTIGRIRTTDKYKSCPPRRMVKGNLGRVKRLTLTERPW